MDPLGNRSCSRDRYDFVVVGSGFGGSVSAYRLSQKGYRVLVVEKGRRYTAQNFAQSNWNLRKWIWLPRLGLKGIMQIMPLRHVTVMSGVGVGGGSLVYGATLPRPKAAFFHSGSWAALADWESELEPHYAAAETMLGANANPRLTSADRVLQELAASMGRESHFFPSTVGIYFDESKKAGDPPVDPFFGGEGPLRSPCIHCGHCMLGCRHGAKNSLDKNYLYLASRKGAEIVAETVVDDVFPAGSESGADGYFVVVKDGHKARGKRKILHAGAVVFAGGVMGTVPLLLRLKRKGSLPKLSDAVGGGVRTNNETITNITTSNRSAHYTEGVSIGSILEVDEHSHVEPIVQGPRSNGWKLMILPKTSGKNLLGRLAGMMSSIAKKPATYASAFFAKDWGPRSFALLFMQNLNSTLAFERGRFGGLASRVEEGEAPSVTIPVSEEITRKVEKLVDGTSFSISTEAILGTPSTAHILGGCVMAASSAGGVIDRRNRVFDYHNLYVCDGSAISANPGVNPSLSIAAMTEAAMSHIPDASEAVAPVAGAR